jgi:hypothetical protein
VLPSAEAITVHDELIFRHGELVRKMVMMARSQPDEEERWKAIENVAFLITSSHTEDVS